MLETFEVLFFQVSPTSPDFSGLNTFIPNTVANVLPSTRTRASNV